MQRSIADRRYPTYPTSEPQAMIVTRTRTCSFPPIISPGILRTPYVVRDKHWITAGVQSRSHLIWSFSLALLIIQWHNRVSMSDVSRCREAEVEVGGSSERVYVCFFFFFAPMCHDDLRRVRMVALGPSQPILIFVLWRRQCNIKIHTRVRSNVWLIS